MLTEPEQRIANAKAIVLAVLAGRLTPEINPAAFEEDSVYISVRIAETHDPEWLLQSIAAADKATGGVRYVLECMSELRNEAEALLASARSKN